MNTEITFQLIPYGDATQQFGGSVSKAITYFSKYPKNIRNVYILSHRMKKYYASFLFDDDIKFIEVDYSVINNGEFLL